MTTDLPPAPSRAEALMESLFNASIATMEVFAVHIGDRLGYYQALADAGPLTSTDLATRTGTNERYTREWLEQQATAGVLDATDDADALKRTFHLPPDCVEVLTDRDSLNYMTPLIRLTVGITEPLDQLLAAFRTGGGVPYPDYGIDTREGIADMNRVMFINQLASEWMVALPDIVDRLNHPDRPARVADIGCGSGWSSIALAEGFPLARVDGYDLDEASIALARENAEAAGLDVRVTFHLRDAADVDLAGQYDLACAFECI
ncbi:MAG TPA: methyltransferase domain-containing protein, partial [Thermomicrobiales bacterium]|nr:methyltransferase domain-containing protein [Thermomicrobiales bacterium]